MINVIIMSSICLWTTVLKPGVSILVVAIFVFLETEVTIFGKEAADLMMPDDQVSG